MLTGSKMKTHFLFISFQEVRKKEMKVHESTPDYVWLFEALYMYTWLLQQF